MSTEPYLPSDPEPAAPPVLPSERMRLDPALTEARPDGHTDPRALVRENVRTDAPTDAPVGGAGESRADRIRAATARGVLGGHVPARYEDDDWETVRSDNPFDVLYLDYRQTGAIGPAVLDDRRQTLAAFWKQKDDVRNRNAGGQRDRIDRKYGFDVGTFAQRVERAHQQLVTPGGLAAAAAAIDEARRRAGERDLQRLVRSCLADGLLTVEETETLLQEGEVVGLTRDETADFVMRVLTDQHFTEREPRRGETLSAVLLSTEWVSPERRARDDAAAARAAERARADARRRDITPIKFRNGAAHTLGELLDLCDRYPDEAAGYLADGVLESWLAGTAGEADAASTAKRFRSSTVSMRRHALELFARALAAPLGRPAVPVITAQPADCAFGAMPQGALRRMRVELLREGRPFVWGTTRIEPELPGVRASRTFENDAAGRPASIDVTVDTVDTAPGDHLATVIVEPAGGARLTVPVRYSVVPLVLTADRPTIDFGTIPLGQTRNAVVHLGVSPAGGRLTGLVRLAEARGGVTLGGEVRDDGADARISVDSRVTGPGVQYRSEVRFETNAGMVQVPITFRIRRASTEAQIWAAGFAAMGGVGMWAARHLLLPGAGWRLAFAGHSHPTSLAAAGAVVATLGFAVRAVLRRVRPS